MADVRVDWHETEVTLFCEHGPPQRALAQLAAMVVRSMKAAAPVSPVYQVYAHPEPKRPGFRAAGDFPLRPSGYLRNSVKAYRMPNGDFLVGPTASYSKYVVEGTPPHLIVSHGPWPLRNRATGQVFGRVVHHPGTAANNFVLRALFSVKGVRFTI